MVGNTVLNEARNYYERLLKEKFNLTGSARYTPDTYKIWEHIYKIVVIAYDKEGMYNHKLERIDENDIEAANKLAIDLIDIILPKITKESE